MIAFGLSRCCRKFAIIMTETPIKKEIVDGLIAKMGIQDFAKATIREVKQVAAMSEKESGVEFIKMEM